MATAARQHLLLAAPLHYMLEKSIFQSRLPMSLSNLLFGGIYLDDACLTQAAFPLFMMRHLSDQRRCPVQVCGALQRSITHI